MSDAIGGSSPTLSERDRGGPLHPVPLRAWLLYGATLVGAVVAILDHGRLVLQPTPLGVAPRFVGCLVALVVASAASTRLGRVTRASAAGWNLVTAALSAAVLTSILAIGTPAFRAATLVVAATELGLMIVAVFLPLATVQVVVGWLFARPDVPSDRAPDAAFVRADEPTWRPPIAAALAAIEGRRARHLDASERQLVGELAFDLSGDPAFPLEIAELGHHLRSILARDGKRRAIAELLATAMSTDPAALDPYR